MCFGWMVVWEFGVYYLVIFNCWEVIFCCLDFGVEFFLVFDIVFFEGFECDLIILEEFDLDCVEVVVFGEYW